jgi:hypothetical protein
LLPRVGDPILRDAGEGVITPLFFQVALAAVVADDFHHEVGSLPILVAHAAGVFSEHENNVGLPILAWLKADG